MACVQLPGQSPCFVKEKVGDVGCPSEAFVWYGAVKRLFPTESFVDTDYTIRNRHVVWCGGPGEDLARTGREVCEAHFPGKSAALR